MKNTEIKGKTVSIQVPAHLLYSAFSDMRNFLQNLPEDKKQGITATEDTIEGDVKGFKLGARISERRPFSYVQFREYGPVPFPFEVEVFLEASDPRQTEFHIELNAELSFMIKAMIGNRLQEMVDKLTDQLALAAEGKLSPENFNMDSFATQNTDFTDLSNKN